MLKAAKCLILDEHRTNYDHIVPKICRFWLLHGIAWIQIIHSADINKLNTTKGKIFIQRNFNLTVLKLKSMRNKDILLDFAENFLLQEIMLKCCFKIIFFQIWISKAQKPFLLLPRKQISMENFFFSPCRLNI